MSENKGSLFQRAKKKTAEPTEPRRESATERFDNQKSKQRRELAEKEQRLRPDSQTLTRGMMNAMAADDLYKKYREALAALRRCIDEKIPPKTKGYVANAQARHDKLRVLKTLVDDDLAADPNKNHDSMTKLRMEVFAVIMAVVQ